jgi:hypothetical protein
MFSDWAARKRMLDRIVPMQGVQAVPKAAPIKKDPVKLRGIFFIFMDF